ncbi:hypothetical protein OG883_11870 [Streptomyces sp. NBC_01142]|uniref:DUF6801 domain-containing protein n=1 Tax=Streptomyces sp. NBC_01142 TaxID=2975865 RepID=UPI00225956B8|nr:DUF6801 domain-containing protein [Streptomyces sp. NBC_01142]MCX4820596.1 hypothetical protein [Streptomyces sp. NBC_01142]
MRESRGPRRAARVAVLGVGGLLAGVLAGPGSTTAQARDAGVTVTYQCRFPSGVQDVRVGFAGVFPDAGAVGRPIQPGETTLRAAIPLSVLDGALPAGTTAIAGTADLTTRVAQNGNTVEAGWPDLVAPLTPLPESGDLELLHKGPVPSVTVTAPGEVTFTASDFTLALRPQTGQEEGQGQPDGLPLPAISCQPAAGQDARLASVAVPAESGPPSSPSPTPGGQGGPEEPGKGQSGPIAVEPSPPPVNDVCPAERPTGELDDSLVYPPPPGAPPKVTNSPGVHGCAYAVGLANVHKLHGAMIINDPGKNPELINVLANKRVLSRKKTEEGGAFVRIDSLGELDLPDAESTFLTFGFQPVTAKVEFTNGPLVISTGSYGSPPNKVDFAVAGFYQSLRLYDVSVNGTPLDVGADCRTARPFKVKLNGRFPAYPNVFLGGPLSGPVTIPEFSGCGTGGEDLDQLFSASISGPGNHIEMNQGTVCVPSQTNTPCPPTMPELPGS